MFDRPELLERVDQDLELLRDLVALYARDWPGLVDQLRQALAQGEAATAQRAAHTLKGMTANLSAAATAEAAHALEQLARQGDLRGAAAAVDGLAAQLAALEEALQSLA
jgi:HPt (histidine-containing phosphotransfer) domain-containing protein